MLASFDKLNRMLTQEKRLGYKNKAILGGLEKLAPNWKSEARPPQLLAALQTAHTQGDTLTMQQTAHSLKSSSATLGALSLSALCAELETLDRANSTVNPDTILSQMTMAYEAVKGALTTELERGFESPHRL
jgi:HPt (histidine-containing phosphotransfer) domain-containing protein